MENEKLASAGEEPEVKQDDIALIARMGNRLRDAERAAILATQPAEQASAGSIGDDAVQFMLNVAKDAAPMLRAADFPKTADLLDVAAAALAAAPQAPSDMQGAERVDATDLFDGDDAALCRSINALLALDRAGALIPHGVGGHARKLLATASLRLDPSAAALAQQAPDATKDRLERIIAYAYQIAGAHDAPEHILDVLANPLDATEAQIEAMLPYRAGQAADSVRDGVLEEAATECERRVMYPGGRTQSYAHNTVWEAAKAIRALKSTAPKPIAQPGAMMGQCQFSHPNTRVSTAPKLAEHNKGE